MSRVLRPLTLAGVAVAVALCAIASSASAQTRLVLDQSGARGWHALSLSARAAKRELSLSLPARSLVDAAGARTRGLVLHSEAFTLPSARAASRLGARWARAHHARPLTIGQGGHLTVRRAGHGDRLVVVWRRVLASDSCTLITGARPRDPVAFALGWARLADTYLRSVLPHDAWQRALDEIRPNGSFSKSTALQAFAAVYGAVPGVPRASVGPRPRSVFSGTLAARHGAAVPPAVDPGAARGRRAASRPARALVTDAAERRRAVRPDYGDPQFHLRWRLHGARAALGLDLRGPAWSSTRAADRRRASPGRRTVGGDGRTLRRRQVRVQWAGGSGFCRIRVGPVSLDLNPVDRGWVLAHEVFHCFEDDITQQNWPYMPAWIAGGASRLGRAHDRSGVLTAGNRVDPVVHRHAADPAVRAQL